MNIDTAVQSASVCLADDDKVLSTAISPTEKESASWLHVAIQKILQENGVRPNELNAIAVSAGPGSYTGLRVGMAAAKGLCYALQLPLITVNTLQMMAAAAEEPATTLLCPMIDARRMEVFTALYNRSLEEVQPSTNLILDESSFEEWLQQNTISFFGNGSTKAATVIQHANALFISVAASAADMVSLSAKKFLLHEFDDLAYTEPHYGKDFHSPISKKFY